MRNSTLNFDFASFPGLVMEVNPLMMLGGQEPQPRVGHAITRLMTDPPTAILLFTFRTGLSKSREAFNNLVIKCTVFDDFCPIVG